MIKTKYVWSKCPSVTREGKSFYTTVSKYGRVWVTENADGLWHASGDFQKNKKPFKTAKAAMSSVE